MNRDKYYGMFPLTIWTFVIHSVIQSVGGFVINITYIPIKDTKTLYPTEGFFIALRSLKAGTGKKFAGTNTVLRTGKLSTGTGAAPGLIRPGKLMDQSCAVQWR